ncbi:RNA polymerase subunit sigma-24 [bacterium]|nr:RNA polymerase subunit sigma-24 [bacterium]
MTNLTMEGGKLNGKQAATLEEELQENSDDIAARTKLLGYYFRKQYEDQSAKTARQGHILWLIENAPESEVLAVPEGTLDKILNNDGYQEGKELWLKQLKDQPDNLMFLKNSANFFLQHDRELAKKSMEKAKAIDADNPKWPEKLGQLYQLDMLGRSGKSKVKAAGKALEQLEIAYDLSDDQARDPLLSRLAKAAFEAEKLDKAKKYALQMLNQKQDDWNSGNNVHYGNIILGRIALAQDNVEEAKQHLIAAGKTEGSPQLDSFGPNMVLAKDLLEVGETEVVLEYFDLCSNFWEMGQDRLKQWSNSVKKGDKPDFKGALYR